LNVQARSLDLGDEVRHVLYDDDLAVVRLRCLLQSADVLDYEAVGLRIVEGLVRHALGVADRAGGQSGLMECIVPTFDIEPREFLQPLAAEVRNDLVFSELPSPARR
jgi:hypothetical protein